MIPVSTHRGSLLENFASDLALTGLVGEQRAAKLLYLCLSSRVLNRPVSAKITGPSSGGKSNLVKAVLRFFPQEAYLSYTSISAKALVYTDEDLRHRVLVIQEAAGLSDGQGAYIVRSLLSEGRIVHEATVGGGTVGSFHTQRVEKEGPTGLILTTTDIAIHPENETRIFTIPIDDSPEQIKAVLLAQAMHKVDTSGIDFDKWHTLQTELAKAPTLVEIPLLPELAQQIPPVANRLRRDFPALRALIETHALLHRESRQLNESGEVVATLDDYTSVYALVADLFSEGVQMTVPPDVRETVLAAQSAGARRTHGINNNRIADELKMDKSTASRRVSKAVDAGYLRRQDDYGGQVSITLGEPLPEDQMILPAPETLAVFGEEATDAETE